ncbi:MAG TPA: hypothetical protein VGM84_13160 [Steroidobacteraceae bacterium]|jgi:hypothetical protein
MIDRSSFRIRKRLLEPEAAMARLPYNEIDLAARATILYSSEDPAYPIENLLDGRSGRGATRWLSARQDTIELIVIEFDRPEHVLRIIFDAEESQTARTQQVTMDYSCDAGAVFRTGFVQEYTFSPHGSTYQREDLGLDLPAVTHVRFTVVPNKGGTGRASLTSVRLFSDNSSQRLSPPL